jgi:hypothetical protein
MVATIFVIIAIVARAERLNKRSTAMAKLGNRIS